MLAAVPSSRTEILLLSRDPEEVAIARSTLDGAGLHVVEDGPSVLGYLRRIGIYDKKRRPSLILLDLDRLGAEESAVVGGIKQDPAIRNIPVIVISPAGQQAANRAYDLRVNAYVRKPSSPDELTRVLRSIFGFWLERVHLPQR